VNRAEVHAWFIERGFEAFEPGGLSFREQIRLIRSAEIIVCEDGSATYSFVFARPGTRLGVLTVAPVGEWEWSYEMFLALGHRLVMLSGPPVREDSASAKYSDYEIDLGLLPPLLEALESA
jgi:hypothetical protein